MSGITSLCYRRLHDRTCAVTGRPFEPADQEGWERHQASLRAAAAAGALAADLVAAPRQAEVWPAEKLSPTVAWALYELSGRSAPDPSANTYVAWRIKHF